MPQQHSGELGFRDLYVETVISQSTLWRDSLWFVSPQVGLSYGLGARWGGQWSLFAVAGGIARFDKPEHGRTQFLIGAANLALGVRYGRSLWDGGHLELHASGIAPLAYLGQDAYSGQRRAAYGWAAAMRGLWDAWLWAPEQTGAALGGVLEHRPGSPVRLRLLMDAAATASFSYATREAGDLYGQVAAEAEVRPGRWTFGMRLQSVWVTAQSNNQQVALSPKIAVRFASVEAWLRWVVNLDEPLGYAEQGLSVGALALGMRGQL